MYIYNNNNKKFWEELIAYFSLIEHEPHRKRCFPQFSLPTCLPNRCVATSGLNRYGHTSFIENKTSHGSVVAYVFIIAGTCIPSRCLATMGSAYRHRQFCSSSTLPGFRR